VTHLPRFHNSKATSEPKLIRRTGLGVTVVGRAAIDEWVEGVRRIGKGRAFCDVCQCEVSSGGKNVQRHGISVKHRQNLLKLRK
jgi:hypothetical protein